MKHRLFRILCACLALVFLCPLALWVCAEGINLGVNIDTSVTDKIVVTLDDSESANAVLSSRTPTLTIPCNFSTAVVTHGNQAIPSTLDTANATIQFQVASGGVYTITPAAYIVTYHANGHGTAPEPLTNVPAGSKLTEPTAPTETGYVFQGWYRTKDCVESGKWNFETDTVTASTNLFAKWVQAYKVTYHNNGHGKAPVSLSNVPEGSKLTEPTAPKADGYTFAGWYKTK